MEEVPQHGVVKMRCDFFERTVVRLIEALDDGNRVVLLYLKLAFHFAGGRKFGVSTIDDICDVVGENRDFVFYSLGVLEWYGLIDVVRGECRLKDFDGGFFRFSLFGDRNRNSLEYRVWRSAVFQRDGYQCRECGRIGGGLEAHHIQPWALNEELRFDVDNGLTLCEECHKKLHKCRLGVRSDE